MDVKNISTRKEIELMYKMREKTKTEIIAEDEAAEDRWCGINQIFPKTP